MEVSGAMLRDGIINAANLISSRRMELNRINVFPVPDSDTGSNMAVTLGAAKGQLLRLPESCTVKEVALTAAAAMLRGSRGNSGAILSLIFRGLAKELADRETASPADLVRGLACGAALAYRAVAQPAEGTILTACRESAADAARLLKRSPDAGLLEVWDCLQASAAVSLKNSTRRLSALKETGVVDAGAKGYCLLIEGLGHVFSGKGILKDDWDEADGAGAFVFMEKNTESARAAEGIITYRITFTSENRLGSRTPESMEKALKAFGEQVVVMDTGASLRCQVFSDQPREVLSFCLSETPLLDFLAVSHGAYRKVCFQGPDEAWARESEGQNRTLSQSENTRPRFCTEFSILKDAADAGLSEHLKKTLTASGDSAVIAEGVDLIKCHIHTEAPLSLIPFSLAGGYLTEIKAERLP